MEHLSTQTKKLGLFMLCLIFFVSVIWSLVCKEHMNGFNALINVAGKQRMLSQKMAYLVSNTEQFTQSGELLEKNLKEFKDNLDFIKSKVENNILFENITDFDDTYFANALLYSHFILNEYQRTSDVDKREVLKRSQITLILLDDAVSQIQAIGDQVNLRLTKAIIGSIILLLLILLYSYSVILRPYEKRKQDQISQYSSSVMLYKNLFEKAKDAMLVFDRNWKLISANEMSFILISQANKSLSLANHYWLNQVFKNSTKEITQSLVDKDGWHGQFVLDSNPNQTKYVSCNAFAINTNYASEKHIAILLTDITKLQQKQKETERLASTDSLTGVLNRTSLFAKLNDLPNNYAASQLHSMFLFIAIDGLKEVNELHGHSIGDKLLKEVVRRLVEYQTKFATLSRFDGDKFAYLYHSQNPFDSGFEFINKLLKEFDRMFVVDELEFKLGCNVGSSVYPVNSKCPEALVQYAEIAMRYSREKSGNNYTLFTESMLKQLQYEELMSSQLQKAHLNGSLHQVFQPIIDLQTNKIVGAELLLRWNDEKLGCITPDIFIVLAEKLAYIYDIDQWSFNYCLQRAVSLGWNGYISLNLSSLHLQNNKVLDDLLASLQKSPLNNPIIFELTETAIIDNIDECVHVMNKIKSHGHSVAIDDFGMGYTSLYYLKTLPIDYIKIDKSFVSDMCYNDNSASIVEAVLHLAKGLGIKVIAEGVEDQNVAEKLASLNCEYSQGYFYDKPIPLETLIDKYPQLKNPAKNASD